MEALLSAGFKHSHYVSAARPIAEIGPRELLHRHRAQTHAAALCSAGRIAYGALAPLRFGRGGMAHPGRVHEDASAASGSPPPPGARSARQASTPIRRQRVSFPAPSRSHPSLVRERTEQRFAVPGLQMPRSDAARVFARAHARSSTSKGGARRRSSVKWHTAHQTTSVPTIITLSIFRSAVR